MRRTDPGLVSARIIFAGLAICALIVAVPLTWRALESAPPTSPPVPDDGGGRPGWVPRVPGALGTRIEDRQCGQLYAGRWHRIACPEVNHGH